MHGLTEDELTPAHRDYWRGVDPDPKLITFLAADDPPGCVPCPGIVTCVEEDGRQFTVVRVAWRPDEIDLAHLARGGTIWLSTWGGLPAHMLEVQAP